MFGKLDARRRIVATDIDTAITAIRENAPWWQIGQVGDFTRNSGQRTRGFGDTRRIAFKQLKRVGM